MITEIYKNKLNTNGFIQIEDNFSNTISLIDALSSFKCPIEDIEKIPYLIEGNSRITYSSIIDYYSDPVELIAACIVNTVNLEDIDRFILENSEDIKNHIDSLDLPLSPRKVYKGNEINCKDLRYAKKITLQGPSIKDFCIVAGSQLAKALWKVKPKGFIIDTSLLDKATSSILNATGIQEIPFLTKCDSCSLEESAIVLEYVYKRLGEL